VEEVFLRLIDPNTLASVNLERLGDSLRADGRLDEASRVFRQLLEIAPNHWKAEQLLASLEGRPPCLPPDPVEFRPAPFVLVPDFLPPQARQQVFDFLLARSFEFHPALTEDGLRPEARRASSRPNCLRGLDPEVHRIFDQGLRAAFESALPRLMVPAYTVEFLEVHGLIYRSGDFFEAHNDTPPNGPRRVTFVYTLHRQPRAFSGGDLLLYDSKVAPPGGEGSFAATHTRLAPTDNRLLLFPSEFFHEVVPVGGVGSDADARIAINGWFHGAPGA
jgi:Rps23 Pro-64 3,4-dihydroxylase Tpa1-like proline 4-hydroxylase